MTHILPIRIYFEDTDADGITYHGSYLNFAERARTEFLRDLGYTNKGLIDDHSAIFVVRHMDINYILPSFHDDQLEIETHVEEVKNSSVIMRQRAIRLENGAPGLTICDMKVTLVCVSVGKYKAVRIPAEIKEAFLKG